MKQESGVRPKFAILLVEDEKEALDRLAQMIGIKYPEVDIRVAANGREGVELFKAQLPDLVVSDINMPEMDGYQMARKIMKLNPDTVIISMTGITEIHQPHAANVGIVKSIQKPLDIKAIFEVIDECISRKTLKQQSGVKVEYCELLSRVIEQSPDAVIISTPNGSIEYVNGKFTQLTGYAPQECTGHDLRALMSGPAASVTPVKAGSGWQGEFQPRNKKGEPLAVELSISPLKGEKGDVTHFIAVLREMRTRPTA
jgi:PAS domain S-box-containing protein